MESAPSSVSGLSTRQRALLEAGVQVVASRGLRGLTHRAIDREAGLPEGSCSAYFRTRLALLSALSDFVAARFTDDLRALTSRIGQVGDASGDHAVRETVATFTDWLDHPALIQTRLELALEGARQPELGAVTTAWGAPLVEIVAGLLRLKGHPDAAVRAPVIVAAMEGVLLRAMREPDAGRRAFLEQSLDLLLRALAVDAPR